LPWLIGVVGIGRTDLDEDCVGSTKIYAVEGLAAGGLRNFKGLLLLNSSSPNPRRRVPS
jgi:hypothetical protein